MKIILKHIYRNIKEKKWRSFLIVLSLVIATTVFVLNLTLPDELVLKLQETLRSIYGKTDISISTVEPFSIDALDIGNEEINYTGMSSLEISLKDKQALIYGISIEQAKELKMLGEDVPSLNKNEVIISETQAENYNYKVGDLLTFTIEDTKHELKIVKIVSKKGITALDAEFPFFISNLETVNEIRNIEIDKYDSLYIDVKNDDNAKSFTEYLKANNNNYLVEPLADIEAIKESISFISYIMIMIFAMATIMIFFVVSSLNKIIIAERMPVIGTFRSVGATKNKMNFILVLENALYGLVGGVIGVFIGYQLNSKVASLFITTSGIELTNKTSQMTFETMLLGIVFSVALEILISIRAIIKANKKSIKEIIFDVQTTRYVIKRNRIVLGSLMLILSIIIKYLNTNMELIPTIISIVLLIIGVANLVPIVIRKISLFLNSVFKKLGWSTGIIASKNIGYNKMIISSSRLLVIALSLMLSILTVSNSFTELFTSFRYTVDDYDIVVQNISKTKEEYNKLIEIDEIKKIEYLYYFWDNNMTYNNGKKFHTQPLLLAQKESRKYIKELDYKIEDLKYDEILIDEKISERNDIKINDTIKIKFETLNKEFEFKVVGLVNSAYFTTSRNVIVMNYENYITNITDVPIQIHIEVKEESDLEKVKEKIENKLKEVGVQIQTVDEYLEQQKEQTDSIMSLFYVIIGLTVILCFIGIVNNQTISFMQRTRELAILNSTCMSKKQIKRMLRTETILSNTISCLLAIVVSFIAIGIIDSFMQGLSLYVEIIYNWKTTFQFIGIVFIILLLTLAIPIKKLRKMNIVNEIKYE